MDQFNNYRLFIFGAIWTQQNQNWQNYKPKDYKIMSLTDVLDAIFIWVHQKPLLLFKLKRPASYVKKRTDWAPYTHKKVFLFKRSITSPAKMIIVTACSNHDLFLWIFLMVLISHFEILDFGDLSMLLYNLFSIIWESFCAFRNYY